MDIFASFATDEKKEVDGAWFDVPGGDARIKVARANNPRFSAAVVKTYEKWKNAPKGEAATKQQDEEYNRLLAQYVLLDWENVSFKGSPLPYSVANAEKLLSIKDFRALVQKFADEIDAYRVEVSEEVGNA